MLWIHILLFLVFAALAADERGLEVIKVLKNEKYSLVEGVEVNIEISLKDVAPDTSLDTLSSHAIMIEVQSKPQSPDYVSMEHVVDLFARMKAPGHLPEFIDIKDTFPVQQGEVQATMVYHYVVYDLCYLNNKITETPKIELKLKSLDSDVLSDLSAKLVKFDHLKINCVDADSQWFLPREDHASCQTWDQKVWVYGGRRNIGKDIEVMGDVMYYDSKLNRWFTGSNSNQISPKPRYGHVMFCYFNYLIVFGGMSTRGELLGDLWAYDIVKEAWTPIIDNKNLLDLQSKNVEGIIPRERAYASGIMLKIMGAGYLVGGKNTDGFACDLWGLKIDKVVQYIEDPESVAIENFWVKKDFEFNGSNEFCRYGHSTAEVTNHTFLIYGGINTESKVIAEPLLYDVLAQELIVLEEFGDDIPPARNKPALLSTGNNMVIMYGGVDPKMKGYLTDLWHFKLSKTKIVYQKVSYEHHGTAYMVSWRSGFTMEFLKGINDPHLIGGTYGNNQQCQALISMPEVECESQEQFLSTTCSPCPRGSIYDPDTKDCKWCEQYEYFEENYDDYFQSKCFPCPRGLIGGTYKSCVPCAGGYIFSSRDKSHCRKCTDDEICPVGTKYAFPKKTYVETMDEIKVNDQPKLVIADELISDNAATASILFLSASTILIALTMALCLAFCKERSLFIYREIDVIAITGGKRKKVVGGILMVFFVYYIATIWLTYLFDYVAHNERRESSETNNPNFKKELPGSFEIEIKAYASKVKESNAPFLIFQAGEEPDANPTDLCNEYKHKIQETNYFKYAEEIKYDCKRKRLNELTDEYTLTARYKNIAKSEIRDQVVTFRLDSDYSQVFHFFNWKVTSVWEYYNDYPLVFSEVEGIMTPQAMLENNKNITSGFKGPEASQLFFNLVPTHYVNEIEGVARDGFRVHFADYLRGSVVNKRTLVDQYLVTGEQFSGFNVQFWLRNNEMLFQVRVQKVKSILEVLAFMLGFLAGFVLIVRGTKYYLLKETYFLELEKKCEKLFGRPHEIRYEDVDDITNVELMRLERTRIKHRQTDEPQNDYRDRHNNGETAQLGHSELSDEDEKDLKSIEI